MKWRSEADPMISAILTRDFSKLRSIEKPQITPKSVKKTQQTVQKNIFFYFWYSAVYQLNYKSKLKFTLIILIPIENAFDHMELCLVLQAEVLQ